MTRLFYDLRLRAILYQVLAVAGVLGCGWYLASNVSQKLAEQNIVTGFAFLWREAGFVISQSFIDYKPTDSFARALLTVFSTRYGSRRSRSSSPRRSG